MKGNTYYSFRIATLSLVQPPVRVNPSESVPSSTLYEFASACFWTSSMESVCRLEKGNALALEKRHRDATRALTAVIPTMTTIQSPRTFAGQDTRLQLLIQAALLYTTPGHEKNTVMTEKTGIFGRVARVVYFIWLSRWTASFTACYRNEMCMAGKADRTGSYHKTRANYKER